MKPREVWVVVAVSCNDCNTVATVVFDHEPNDEEQAEAAKSGGGMFCFSTSVIKCAVNGEGGRGKMDKY
jgi:4-hydroxy-3-methylbut-2-en-1-yl diphosphate synthase IspG/GcpE